MNLSSTMTPRQRWLAALRLEPLDRLPFWPKLDGAYVRAQARPFRDMDVAAVYAWLGSDRQEWVGDALRETRRRTAVETQRHGDEQRTVYRTAAGQTEQVLRLDAATQSWHPVRFPVRGVEDIRLLTEIYADVTVEVDRAALDDARRRVREIGRAHV